MTSLSSLSGSTWVLVVLAVSLSSCGDRLRASGSTDVAPSGGSPPPIVVGDGPPPIPGLVSAVGGDGRLRVEWDGGEEGSEVALFAGGDPDTLLAGAPVLETTGSGHHIVENVPDGRTTFFALGVRPPGGAAWVRAGGVLEARSGAPIHVDAAADPAQADGLTPATAFTELLPALLTAFARGGANVWVREGDYADVVVPVFDGTHLYGGFDGAFDLDARDPEARPTVFHGAAGLAVLDVRSPLLGAIVDGVRIAGDGVASIGVDASDARLSLRGVHVTGCNGRGIRLRAVEDDTVEVDVRRSSSVQNGGDGLSAAGAFDLRLESCAFESNVQEGVDLDDLVAPQGGSASLRVRGSVFRGNGTDGLDVDLAPPLLAFPGSGRFEVRVERSLFESNGEEGLLVDVDYETAPTWSADIAVEGCRARDNGASGVHLDLDAAATAVVHRASASANAGDGIWISSETAAGIAVVAASAGTQNGGAGIRASLGNQVLLVTHCVVAGNGLGGVVSDTVTAGVSSTVAHREATPFSGAEVTASVATALPAEQVFLNAPDAYARVLAFDGVALTLDRPLAIPFGAPAETDDDGTARTIEQRAPNVLELDPSPVAVPAGVAVFPPGGSVDEDLRPAPGSPAQGAGMADPLSPVDAGPFGAPRGGAPGTLEDAGGPLFRVVLAAPAPTVPLGTNDPIAFSFAGGTLDAASVGPTTVRAVSASGATLAVALAVVADRLEVGPPPGGWTEPFRVELLSGLAATGGELLSTPVAVPFAP